LRASLAVSFWLLNSEPVMSDIAVTCASNKDTS
jgi:hypothetical protein